MKTITLPLMLILHLALWLASPSLLRAQDGGNEELRVAAQALKEAEDSVTALR